MLLLNSASSVIKLITSAAASIDVHASYVDRTSTTDTPDIQNTPAINTATTTNVVSAPSSSTSRNIRTLSMWNTHATATCVVTVQHYDGTNTVQKFKAPLPPGWGLIHHEGYWTLYDPTGAAVTQPMGGRSLGISILTSASGTFTTGKMTRQIFIRGVGAGGGGAGCTSVASAASAGGGGGAGAYAEKLFNVSPDTGYSYTCGAAGTGASGAAGNNGTSSTFVVGATTVTAPGGSGAAVATAVTTLSSYPGGTGGAIATNGDVNAGGQNGENGHIVVVATPSGGSGGGGSGIFGGGGAPRSTVGNGTDGNGYGAGGGGAMTGASQARTGGSGTAGCWFVEELS